jgi:hypothetical protein
MLMFYQASEVIDSVCRRNAGAAQPAGTRSSARIAQRGSAMYLGNYWQRYEVCTTSNFLDKLKLILTPPLARSSSNSPLRKWIASGSHSIASNHQPRRTGRTPRHSPVYCSTATMIMSFPSSVRQPGASMAHMPSGASVEIARCYISDPCSSAGRSRARTLLSRMIRRARRIEVRTRRS